MAVWAVTVAAESNCVSFSFPASAEPAQEEQAHQKHGERNPEMEVAHDRAE